MKLLRVLIRTLLCALLLLAAGVLIAGWLAVDGTPAVAETAALSPDTANRALKQIARQDPRRKPAGTPEQLVLRDDELDVLVRQAARHLRGTRASTRLSDDVLELSISQPLPFGRWLNAGLQVTRGGDDRPTLQRLTVGRLPLPAPLARWLLLETAVRAAPLLDIDIDPLRLTEVVHSFHATPQELTVGYVWQPGLWQEGARALLPASEEERLAAYNGALLQIVSDMRRRQDKDLMHALQPLFATVIERSLGHDAIAEQRSALLTLALFVDGRSAADLLPDARAWPRAPALPLTVRGRDDLAQHLLSSAVLALFAGTRWSDALGLSKEISDSRGGSGFSFIDLLADRTGTRLGEQIAAGRGDVARRLAAGLPAEALLPDIDGLSEFMPEAEFRRRFGGIGAPAYQTVIRDIEARIGALPLYQ
ncbi:MAG TPA: hypothetical protein VIO81_06645 [Methyloversatilis sp.]